MKRFLIVLTILVLSSSLGLAQDQKFGLRLGLGIPDIVGFWAKVPLTNALELRGLATAMPFIIFNAGVLELDLIFRAGNGFYLGGGGGALIINNAGAAFSGFTPYQTVFFGFIDFLFGYQVPVSKNTTFYVEARPVVIFNSPLPLFMFLGVGVDISF